MRVLTRMKTSTALGWSALAISASKMALRCSVCRRPFLDGSISEDAGSAGGIIAVVSFLTLHAGLILIKNCSK